MSKNKIEIGDNLAFIILWIAIMIILYLLEK